MCNTFCKEDEEKELDLNTDLEKIKAHKETQKELEGYCVEAASLKGNVLEKTLVISFVPTKQKMSDVISKLLKKFLRTKGGQK